MTTVYRERHELLTVALVTRFAPFGQLEVAIVLLVDVIRVSRIRRRSADARHTPSRPRDVLFSRARKLLNRRRISPPQD